MTDGSEQGAEQEGPKQERTGGRWITPEAWFLFRWMSPAMLVGCMWGMTVTTIIRSWWVFPASAAILAATLLFGLAGPPPIVSRWIARLRQRA